MVSDHKQVCIT